MYRVFVSILAGTVAALAVGGVAAAAPPGRADLVYRNGFVYTVDAHNRIRQAVAIRAGRIVYAGTDRGVQRFVGLATRSVDLHGRMLMPGLIDGHMHPFEAGRMLLKCDLHYAALTVPEMQALIKSCLEASRDQEPDRWLEVVSWFQEAMRPEGVVTTKAVLDSLATSRPILVRSSFGHSGLANSRALALVGINAGTPEPLGGKIWRDESGAPTGRLEDAANAVVWKAIPEPTPAEDETAVRAALAAMNRQGVTSFLEAIAPPAALAAFRAIERAGGLTARAHFAPMIEPETGKNPARAVAEMTALAQRYDEGPLKPDPSLTVRNAKLFMDGVITAPALTGVMLAPYYVNAGTAEHARWEPGASSGPEVYFPAPLLAEILTRLAKAGIDPHLHADGDGAVRAALDAIAAMRAAVRRSDIRPAIAHDEIVDPGDFGRFRQLRALPVLSFQWGKPAPDTVDGDAPYLGPARAKLLEPAGLLAANGARVCFGSDWPVDALDEWFALKVGVTRTNAPSAGPKYAGRLGEDPGLSRRQVLRAATINSAYELHQERVTGSIEVGKFADLIVLDRNPLTVPAEEIANIKVLQTLVGGREVYAAPGFGP